MQKHAFRYPDYFPAADAVGLGSLAGYERQPNNQPASLRAYIILVAGAALAVTLSINLAIEFRPQVANGDPARLTAQVISGIGFLGFEGLQAMNFE